MAKLQSRSGDVLKDTLGCISKPMKCNEDGTRLPTPEDILKLAQEALKDGVDLFSDLNSLYTRGRENEARMLETERQRRQVDRDRRSGIDSPDSPPPPLPPPPPPIPPEKVAKLSDTELRERINDIDEWCYENRGDRCFDGDPDRFRDFLENHPNARKGNEAAYRAPDEPVAPSKPPVAQCLKQSELIVLDLKRQACFGDVVKCVKSCARFPKIDDLINCGLGCGDPEKKCGPDPFDRLCKTN